MSARLRVAELTRSFEERDAGLVGGDPLRFDGYDPTGDAACIWGWADVDGTECAIVVFDFAHLGGSMGMAVGDKIVRAFDAARRKKLPIVTVTASGGARMQEGMWSLVQMAKTVEAHRAHASAGLAHVTLITSPTTGGVYASFASLADVILAEPGATVGFAGPRVVEELTGSRPPADVHTAEFAHAHGLIDAIVERDRHAVAIGRALRALTPQRSEASGTAEMPGTDDKGPAPGSAWDRVVRVRDPAWPKANEVLDALLVDDLELHGDRAGGDDEHVILRVGAVRGTALNAVAVGQQATGDGRIRPSGFRKAIRAIETAGRLGLPVVTVIDTRGADPTPQSERDGVAVAIAKTFEAMLGCPTPTLCLLTGEGGSGGALSMAVADRVLAYESAVFSVIAPEGAATILYRDASRAPELAERMRITTADLTELGFVDAVVADPPLGVPSGRVAHLAREATRELTRLANIRQRRRLGLRHSRWRGIASAVSSGGASL